MMRICFSLLVNAIMMSTVFAEDKTAGDLARQYTDAFLAGDMQTLFDHANPELQAAMKNVDTMNALRTQSVGDKAVAVDEKSLAVTTRIVKAANGQTFSITASVSADGKLVGFLIQPTGEAPSEFLNYRTKANLRLPFQETWNVFWGGRSVMQNYHAAFPDQRFANDILILRDGATHIGQGKENSDYHCFGKPIGSPGTGVVVEAVDGIEDNIPGKLNPAQPCGNHVVIDLGENEFLFLAHFKNGSLKVKAGDHVQPGQALGLCGNSGNSSEPHLHVHLQNTPIYGAGKGLPLQFQHYLADGKAVDRGEPAKGQAISMETEPN